MIRPSRAALLMLPALLAACAASSGPDPRSLASVLSETAGANCPTGGQKILTGLDLNGDGVLEANEVQQVAYVCNGASAARCTTLEGSVIVRNSFDWANLAAAGCTRITGNLEIIAPGLIHVAEPSPLVRVGTLLVHDNDQLAGLSLPALTQVDGEVSVLANPLLASLTFPALAAVGSTLAIVDNPALASLDLSALSSTPDYVLLENAYGLNGAGEPTPFALRLPALQHLGLASFTIRSTSIDRLELPNLVDVGALEVGGCDQLESLDLPLQSAGQVSVQGAAALRRFALPALADSSLMLSALPSLTALEAPALASGGIVLQGAPALVDLVLPAFTSGPVDLAGLGVRDTLSLPALAAGSLSVDGCPALQAIALPAFSSGRLRVAGNPALTAISAPLLTTSGSIDVLDNPLLPALDLPALSSTPGGADSDGVHQSSHLTVSGNASLTDLRLHALAAAGGDVRLDVPAVTTIDLGSLATVSGSLFISSEVLTRLELPALATIGWEASLACGGGRTSALATVSLPSLTSVHRDLSITGHVALAALELPSLSSAGGLVVAGSALAQLSLPSLVETPDHPYTTFILDPGLGYYVATPVHSTGGLVLVDTATLTSVALPALATAARTIDFSGNSELASLSLPALTSVGVTFAVHDDPALAQCQVDAVVARLQPPLPATISVGGNLAGATCP